MLYLKYLKMLLKMLKNYTMDIYNRRLMKKQLEHFMKKNYKKTKQKDFRIEKVIKKKDDKMYLKRKSCDNSFNSRIDKKDII